MSELCLVTGGAGFIGSHVCERLLRDGHSVWAFDDLNDFYDPQLKRAIDLLEHGQSQHDLFVEASQIAKAGS